MNEQMKQLLRSDELYDKESLIFDGNSLRREHDPMDSDRVLEGRMGMFYIRMFKTEMGIRLTLPITQASSSLNEAPLLADTASSCVLATEDRFLSLTVLESETDFSSDPRLIQWTDRDSSASITQWAGLMDTPVGGCMLGIVCRIRSGDGRIFLLTYAGIGNFTDIRMEKTEIVTNIHRRLNQ